MARRRRIVIASAGVVLAFGIVVVALVGVGTRTEFGQERVRRFLAAWLSSRVRGTMYVGKVRGGFVDGVTVDSLEIRDDRGELFIASGPALVRYDLRDVYDRRLVLDFLELTRPVVHLRRYPDGTWNFRRIFPRGQPEPIGSRRGFGDFVVIDSAAIRDGTFMISLPWRPDDSLSDVEQAQQIAKVLAETPARVRRTAHGLAKSWSWNDIHALFGPTRLAHPDTAGRVVAIRSLSMEELYPPLSFRNVRGELRQLADSLWLDLPAWRFPGSSGSARGKLIWGGNRPVRYDIRVRGDRMALGDLAWIYPTFPRTGGGRMDVHVRNAVFDERVIEHAVTNIDVTTDRSRLTGRAVVDPHGEILAVRDVRMRADPVDFDLLRTLNGGPFPYDWRGSFTGDVVARGGPVNRFRVDESDLTFNDAGVPGAVSRFSGSGTLDISDPAFTVFHGFRVNASRLDLRTPRRLNPEFPRVNGVVSGVATLDSLWLDVRLSRADVVHRDGSGPTSRFTGHGRVTLDKPFLTYDLDIIAQPVSLTTLARSYPFIPARGEMSGPVRIRGQAPRLLVVADLSGAAGHASFDGEVDLDPPSLGVVGRGRFARLDLSRLVPAPRRRTSSLSGEYEVSVRGAEPDDLAGTVSGRLEPSSIGNASLSGGVFRGSLAGGLVRVDTAFLATGTARGSVVGTASVRPGVAGRLVFDFTADSLGEVATLLGLDAGMLSSIRGRATVAGVIEGAARSRTMHADLTGERMEWGKARAARMTGSLQGSYAALSLSAVAETVGIGGLDFSTAQLSVTAAAGGASGAFAVALVADNGARTSVSGRAERSAEGISLTVDSAALAAGGGREYRSSFPVRASMKSGRIDVDSVVLVALDPSRRTPSVVALHGLTWSDSVVRGVLRTRNADLAVLQSFVPSLTQASGPLDIELTLDGTPRRPVASGFLRIDDGMLALGGTGVEYERVRADILFGDGVIRVRDLSAQSVRGGGRRGSLSVAGTFDVTEFRSPVFALEANAREFRAINRRGLATLDISTTPALTLTGPFDSATLRGSITVNEGTVFLPERLGKEVLDPNDPELLRLADTVAGAARRFLPRVPSRFVTGLTLDDVNVVVGDDVWLRSSEANIELGGSLRVTRTRAATDDSQLALVGALNAVRGTYVLNLAVVQPTFQVERGTLRFFGTPEVNPTLDIRAIHTVRQPRQSLNREDVRVLVAITGTLRDPQLTLSSADSLPLSQSDLLSYLVTGEPSFALTGTSTEYAEQILTLGGRLAGTLLSSRIPRSLFDIVEVRTGAVRLDAANAGVTTSYLNSLFNTRVILGKQLSDRWYLGLSTGLCRASFAENLGLRLEYRFGRTYTAQGGIEPGSGELACVGPTASRAFQQTPPQLGGDIFRTWRF